MPITPPPDTFPFGQSIVWQPDPDLIAASNLRQFMDRHAIADYAALLDWANADIGRFWVAALNDLAIEFYTPYSQIVDLGNGIEQPTWCVGGEMNIVHNCLDKWVKTETGKRMAIRYECEEGEVRTLTYIQLYEEVNRCANALRSLGLGKGDAVGLYMPMTPELVIAFLAVIKIGAITLPLFSGFGPAPIIARLVDAEAKAVITADGMMRRGKITPMKPVLDDALASVPSVKQVIVVNRLTPPKPSPKEGGSSHGTDMNGGTGQQPDLTSDRSLHSRGGLGWGEICWHDLIPQQASEAASERTSAEDVMMIIYTSGTTGKPKGTVHTHCGFAIKGALDWRQCMDLKAGEVFHWVTDMGWVMGPMLVFSTLLNGATMVLYDGAPDYPDVDRLWGLIDRHKITHLGVSPTLIRALRPHGSAPVEKHDLSSLRMGCSTGSAWDPESWLWFFNTVLGGSKPIINYSGGTEISGGIIAGNLLTPLKPCSFGGPVPGIDTDVVDEQGKSVKNAVGELVVRQPWIGMTRGFWRDSTRYHETYWSRIPGLWVHGDFAAIDADNLWYVLGRSDDTIKVAGKRLGPAEVESILNAHPAVVESAAIGVPHPIKDNEVVAYCVLRGTVEPSEELRAALMTMITKELGKPLKPRVIKFATALPKTRNAKVMHRVIRAAHLGLTMGDLSSLENPATVEAIRNAV